MKNVFSSVVTLKAIQEQAGNEFAATIGLKFTELGPDYLSGKVVIDDRHLRPGAIMNGGVSLALIETVGSVAARCTIADQPKNTLGIQVSASHLQIARPGDELTATARPAHVGRSTQIWDVTIVNQLGKMVSTGRITLLVVDKN